MQKQNAWEVGHLLVLLVTWRRPRQQMTCSRLGRSTSGFVGFGDGAAGVLFAAPREEAAESGGRAVERAVAWKHAS